MKITAARVRLVTIPAEEPLANGPVIMGPVRRFVLLDLQTDAGIEGIGFTYFGGNLAGSLASAVQVLAEAAVGSDPLAIEALIAKLRASTTAGPAGMVTLALAAIDIALWDIKGKALGVPVATLCGGARTKAPVYASGALSRDATLDHCVRAAAKLKDAGWRQMKTQLALPAPTSARKEVERIGEIRRAVGDEIDLMCDINWRWDVRQAISIGARIEEYGLFWLEDVVAAEDYQGLAEVSRALATPIAAGEFVWGIVPFRHMLEMRSVDIPMMDVMRTGGITGWLKIAAMAEAFNLPVVSHLYPEISVHLVCGVPNGLTVEYMPWSNRLFTEPAMMRGGELHVPQKPGLGLEFDEKTLARHAS